MRRRDLLLALPLLSLARGQGGGDWTEAFGAFIQKVPPASYLSARTLVSQHGVPKPGLWKGFPGAPTAAKAAVGYLVYPTEANDLLLFEPLVLDVRTPEERKRGFIPGSVHIYAGEVPRRLAQLPEDKEALILVYCNSGRVSMVIAAYLQALGYKNAKNIAHGFKGWLDAGLPVEVEG